MFTDKQVEELINYMLNFVPEEHRKYVRYHTEKKINGIKASK